MLSLILYTQLTSSFYTLCLNIPQSVVWGGGVCVQSTHTCLILKFDVYADPWGFSDFLKNSEFVTLW